MYKNKISKIIVGMLLFLCVSFFANMDAKAVAVSRNSNSGRKVSYYIKGGRISCIKEDSIWLECKGGNTGYLKTSTYTITSKTNSKCSSMSYFDAANVLFDFSNDTKYEGDFTGCYIHFASFANSDNVEKPDIDSFTLSKIKEETSNDGYANCDSIPSSYEPAKDKAYFSITKAGKCYFDYEEKKWKSVNYNQSCSYYTYKKYGALQDEMCNGQSSGKCHYTANGCEEKNNKPTGNTSNVTIAFNTLNGYMEGYTCPSGTTAVANGLCSGQFKKGTTVNYPSNYKNVYNNDGYLIGWTTDSNAACSAGNVDETFPTTLKADSSKTLYACYKVNVNGKRYALDNASKDGKSIPCGTALNITYCRREATGEAYCYYNNNGETGVVYKQRLALSEPNCGSSNNNNQEIIEEEPPKVDESEKKCSNEEKEITGTSEYTWCYKNGTNPSNEEVSSKINDLIVCDDGYVVDTKYTSAVGGSPECNDYICKRNFNVRCVREDSKEEIKPILSVNSGMVGSNGEGTIGVTGSSKAGKITHYYVSEIYKTPSDFDKWVSVNSNTFTISKTPGIHYIWIKDIEGNVSEGIGGAVFDTVNTNTTLSSLKLEDSNGELKTPTGNTAYKVKGITNSSYVRLSNKLVNESVIAENGFNPFNMEYKVEVSSPTITVYATLTSTDSNYVNGYEPRTVNLDYGMNTILIKIQNNEGKVRTYTILVNRVDDRTADNTLSDLSIDVGNIDFNSNKTEYKIEIPVSTQKVNVNATIGSDKASFVDGYAPGVVNINGDTTVSFIKVKSQTGSTRTYVLTFVKKGTDKIKDKSLQLYSLSIPDAYLAFEPSIANYSLSVGYETESIGINAALMDEDSSYVISIKTKNSNDYKVVSNKGILLDVGENYIEIKVTDNNGKTAIYRLTVIRKEFGLDVSNDTNLKDLSVLGYDIDFEPNKKEYTVRIKQEKTLVITAIPNNNRAEVFIRGNDELTGFSTVRVKVVAENGEFDTYSIDIKKDAFNKTIEIAAIVAGVVIILGSSCIIVIKNKNKKKKEYFEE